MKNPSNTSGDIGGGTITPSSGTKGKFDVATSNTQKSGALGPKVLHMMQHSMFFIINGSNYVY
ncbi:hypothetical protein HVZ54_13310 [Escherichia coli]|nr:hypothetical protein [Escherichia coli]